MAVKDAYAATDQGNINSRPTGSSSIADSLRATFNPLAEQQKAAASTAGKTNTKYTNTSGMSTKDAQQMLKDAGYDIGSYGVDGVWGKDTQAAWEKYSADKIALQQQQAANKQQLENDLATINTKYGGDVDAAGAAMQEAAAKGKDTNGRAVEQEIAPKTPTGYTVDTGHGIDNIYTDYSTPVKPTGKEEITQPAAIQLDNPGVKYPVTKSKPEIPYGVLRNTDDDDDDNSGSVPYGVLSSKTGGKITNPAGAVLEQALTQMNSGGGSTTDHDLTPDDIYYQDHPTKPQVEPKVDDGGLPPAQNNGGGAGGAGGAGVRIGDAYSWINPAAGGSNVPATGGDVPATGGNGGGDNGGGQPTGSVDVSADVSSMPQYYGQSFAPWINDWYLRNGAYQNEIAELNRQLAEERVKYNTDLAVRDLSAQYTRGKQDYDRLIGQNAISAATAADNLAFRNAANGDRGGIGAKLYSDQQASYDANLYNIQLEQINLKNQIDQKVADYIAQGQYELANNYAQIGNQLLQNLQSQENAYLQNMNTDFWNVQDYNVRNRQEQRELAEAHLKMGFYNAQDLDALGINEETAKRLASYYADQYDPMLYQTAALQRQIEAEREAKAQRAASGGSSGWVSPIDQMYALDLDNEADVYAWLRNHKYTEADVQTLVPQYMTERRNRKAAEQRQAEYDRLAGYEITNRHGDDWVVLDDGNRYSLSDIGKYVADPSEENPYGGTVQEIIDPRSGTITYRLTPTVPAQPSNNVRPSDSISEAYRRALELYNQTGGWVN